MGQCQLKHTLKYEIHIESLIINNEYEILHMKIPSRYPKNASLSDAYDYICSRLPEQYKNTLNRYIISDLPKFVALMTSHLDMNNPYDNWPLYIRQIYFHNIHFLNL